MKEINTFALVKERKEKEKCNDDNPLIMLFRTEMMFIRFKGD